MQMYRKRQSPAVAIVTGIHLEESAASRHKAAMGLFSLRPRRTPEGAAVSKRIAAEARAALTLGEDDHVTVSQIDCGDPACEGGAETVILVMRKGERTKAAKIAKAMHLVTEDEVVRAVGDFR